MNVQGSTGRKKSATWWCVICGPSGGSMVNTWGVWENKEQFFSMRIPIFLCNVSNFSSYFATPPTPLPYIVENFSHSRSNYVNKFTSLFQHVFPYQLWFCPKNQLIVDRSSHDEYFPLKSPTHGKAFGNCGHWGMVFRLHENRFIMVS